MKRLRIGSAAQLARPRDIALRPAGRMPFGKTHMLRVLSDTQVGLFGPLALEAGFLEALGGHLADRGEPTGGMS